MSRMICTYFGMHPLNSGATVGRRNNVLARLCIMSRVINICVMMLLPNRRYIGLELCATIRRFVRAAVSCLLTVYVFGHQNHHGSSLSRACSLTSSHHQLRSMDFCSRCGEPCALATCSCGGQAKSTWFSDFMMFAHARGGSNSSSRAASVRLTCTITSYHSTG